VEWGVEIYSLIIISNMGRFNLLQTKKIAEKSLKNY
jgi:hypothetical protein